MAQPVDKTPTNKTIKLGNPAPSVQHATATSDIDSSCSSCDNHFKTCNICLEEKVDEFEDWDACWEPGWEPEQYKAFIDNFDYKALKAAVDKR